MRGRENEKLEGVLLALPPGSSVIPRRVSTVRCVEEPSRLHGSAVCAVWDPSHQEAQMGLLLCPAQAALSAVLPSLGTFLDAGDASSVGSARVALCAL